MRRLAAALIAASCLGAATLTLTATMATRPRRMATIIKRCVTIAITPGIGCGSRGSPTSRPGPITPLSIITGRSAPGIANGTAIGPVTACEPARSDRPHLWCGTAARHRPDALGGVARIEFGDALLPHRHEGA